jgi:hypothetical protein
MASSLIKPSGEALADPEQALLILMRLYEAVDAIQKVAAALSVVNLGALTADPGAPPPGKVYTYTIKGSLYARTATAPYLLAL